MIRTDHTALAAARAEHLKSGGDVITEAAFASGWQACAAYYAPKLTEPGAVEIAVKTLFQEADKNPWAPDANRECKAIISALRAAGVRFKAEGAE
jgi:hypothetical protein